MLCVPDSTAGCIVQSALSTDWEDCDSIDSYCTSTVACVTSNEHDCDAEIGELFTCLETLEEDDHCPEACNGETKDVAAEFATKLRGINM